MSLKQLKTHLLGQDYRRTQLEEMPDTAYPQFVQDKLAAHDRKQKRIAAKLAKNSAYGVLANDKT